MDIFKEKINECIVSKWLTFPWIEKDVILNKVLASAEEYVLTNIASDLLSKDDRDLFRDSYLSAPDIFDADEFLSERISDYDNQVELYFDKWLKIFRESL